MTALRLSLLALAMASVAGYAQPKNNDPGSAFWLPQVPSVQPLNANGNAQPKAPPSPQGQTKNNAAKEPVKPVNTSKIALGASPNSKGENANSKTAKGGAKKPEGAAASAEDCQLVAINDAARQNMQGMMNDVVDILFNDPDFRGALEASAKTGGKCVADITKIWDNLKGGFKIGNGLSSIGEFFENFDPMGMLGDLADAAIEEACQMAKQEVMGMFGKVTDLLSQQVSLGPLGGISTNALIRYDGTATFDVNAHGPSTSSIMSYLDNIWK